MSDTPTRAEVDKVIAEIACEELTHQPIGSTVMVDGCIGFKKMGYWWVYRVHGVQAVISLVIEEIRRVTKR